MTLEKQIAELTTETTKLIDVVNEKLSNALYELSVLRKYQAFDVLVSGLTSIKTVKEAQDFIIEEREKSGQKKKHYTIFVRSFNDTKINITISNISLVFHDCVSLNLKAGEAAVEIGNETQRAENIIIRGGSYNYEAYNDNNIPIKMKNGSNAEAWSIRTQNANPDPIKAGLDHIGPVFNKET